jgi:2-oxoglutarate dehydrogenase E1 component
VYYDLAEYREQHGRNDVAIVRVEQLYPLRTDLLSEALAVYAGVSDLRWVQEEPANMGAWSHLRPDLERLCGRAVSYVGRPSAAAPATGSHRQHKEEQDVLMAAAFSGTPSTQKKQFREKHAKRTK